LEGNLCFLDKSKIAYEILAYLLDHPDAQDTLEGVAEWWLLERKIRDHVEIVKEALDELVREGWVIQLESVDSRIHYRTNRSRYGEIRTLLKQVKGG
jgi:hypothetical protein